MKSSRKILFASILNFIFVIIEFIGGIFTNSISIMSDAIQDLGDSISLFLAWILERKSYHKPDKVYTFGYDRYSLIGALVTSIILFSSISIVIYNAVGRIINPETVNYDGMLILAIFGIIINGIAMYITSDKKTINEEAVSIHLLDDVLGWFSIIIVSIVGKLYNLPILDPILSICISAFILYKVIMHLKKSIEILLERKPDNISGMKLKKDIIEKYEHIIELNHIHIWSLSKRKVLLTTHMVLDKDLEESDRTILKENIRKDLKKYSITDVTIEMEVKNS